MRAMPHDAFAARPRSTNPQPTPIHARHAIGCAVDAVDSTNAADASAADAFARAATRRAAAAPIPSACAPAIVAALFATALAAQEPPTPTVTTLQLPETTFVTDAMECDVDGDGRRDLVLAVRDAAEKARAVHVHLRQRDGAPFAAAATTTLPIERDVVAFAFADVLPTAGRECVLFTAERAVALTLAADGAPQYEPLGAIQLVWPAPSRGLALALDEACIDLDGDGKDDLLAPEPDGAVLLRTGQPALRLSLPPWRNPATAGQTGAASMRGDGSRLVAQFEADANDDGDASGSARGRGGPLASASFRAPMPRVLDLDGDGAVELVAVRNDRAHVARVRDGALQQTAIALPLPPDRLTAFDPAFDVQLADCNGDKKADLVLTTSARRGDEVEVRIDLFVAKADGTFGDKQDSRLRVQTLAGAPQLVDCDGDGVLDLAVRTVRLDTLRAMTGDAPNAIETQLTIFRGAGDRFVQPALLATVLRVAVREGGGQPYLQLLPGGGGAPGSVLLREDDRLLRRPLANEGRKLRLDPPDCAMPLPKGARIDGAVDAKEAIVRRAHEVLFVRMP
jgi:hypothetical protein